MRKILSVILLLSLLINCFSISAFADNKENNNVDNIVTFDSVKEKAIRQNKVINMNEYENEMKNAVSESERQEILNKYKKYHVNETIVYPNEKLNSGDNFSLLTAEGSNRIVYSYLYGGASTYSEKYGSSLGQLTYTVVSIGVGWSHPAVGAFMSVLGLYIPEYQYGSYTNIVQTTLHDYVIMNKQFQVYNGSAWITMVTSQKKETSAQLNTVHYKNGARQNPINRNLNIVREDIGNLYYNEATLLAQAVNLYFSGSSPFVYYYYNGQTINYNNDALYFSY